MACWCLPNSRASTLGGSGSSLVGLGLGVTGSLLLLDILGDELLVLGGLLLGCLEALKLLSLDELLAAEAFLSDEALDLGGLVVSLVATLDLALGNVLANVVLLWETIRFPMWRTLSSTRRPRGSPPR